MCTILRFWCKVVYNHLEIFDDGYYLSLRDLEDDLSNPIQIKNLHHLQNLLMDLYGHDIKIDKLYGNTGE